ncbi:MAG: epoxyqueuosine reductase QueH [candidate division Zixibacteria bacterium]|nr:epoxyqueuosine reductase QueH [Candidatus Tariuqbacter arcticus]
MKKLLLHICCAPDQTVAVERTIDEYDVTGFFSNSCIEPRGEYFKRLDDAKYLANLQSIELIEDEYFPEKFLAVAKGLEKEPENGKRCLKCIEYRLRRTAEASKKGGFAAFATTLTVSPHKDAEHINRVGEELAWEFDIEYLPTDFKKKDGFKRSVELSNKLGLYRQDYCGCRFSLKQKKERDRQRAEEITAKASEESSQTGQSLKLKAVDPASAPPGAFYKPPDSVSRRFKKGKR